MKKFMVLTVMLALMLVAAAPAMAQDSVGGGEISVTGYVQCAYPIAGGGCDAGGWNIIDLDSGLGYALQGDFDFSAHTGQYVTLYGVEGTASNGDRLLNVSQIEPAVEPGTPTPASYTVTFELAVQGQPPAGTSFFAQGPVDPALADVSNSYQLTDPDGDGVYTASTVVSTGDYPVSFVQGVSTVSCSQNFGGTCPGEPVSVIKDLGTVSVGQDTTYSASVSFDDQVAPKKVAASGDQYTTGAVTGGTGAPSGDKGILATILPDTGGLPLVVLGAGVLLLGTGTLAARRFFR